MLDAALVGTLALMGVASIPHCALMCTAPCAAAVGAPLNPGAVLGFQTGRVIGYALAGAVVASGLGALQHLAAHTRALHLVWTLLHTGFLALGLYLLAFGRWPAWLGVAGHKVAPVGGRWRGAASRGLIWWAWPCGALQGALLVSALANTPAGAGLAMAAFALASSPALLAGPTVLRRAMLKTQSWAPRVAGAMLLMSSAWALGHGLWSRLLDWCT
jgi:uncharacterized protein